MANSLANLVNNLCEENSNVNTDMMIKNVRLVELNTWITTVFPNI